MMASSSRQPVPSDPEAGVVLLAMGGPGTVEEVRPFLEELFSDPEMIRLPRWMRRFQRRLARRIAKRRSREVEKKYASIGGSPLVPTTEALARQVAESLREEGVEAVTIAGMRYGAPRAPLAIGETFAHLAETRPGAPVILLPQYPFYSTATTASSLKEAEEAVRELGLTPVSVLRFGGHPEHIDLMVSLTRDTLDRIIPETRKVTHLLISVHGLPERYVRDGDPYQDEVVACVDALRERLQDEMPPSRIHLSFQSRVGPVRWIRPATDDTIVRLAKEGVQNLVVLPLGFTCDHLETLEEIDILYAELAKEHGYASFTRVPTPGLDPRYVQLQARLVKENLSTNGRH